MVDKHTPVATNAVDIAIELNRRFGMRTIQMAGDYGYLPVSPRVYCADGFNVSVQARDGAYCSPRDNSGPYYQVECGYPSAPMPSLAEWIEADDPQATDTVWCYVPIDKVGEVLAEHGGLLSEEDAATLFSAAKATGA